MILLAGIAIVPAIARAAEPNAPSAPNASAAKKNAAARPAAPPARNPPRRAAVRTPASFTPQMPLSEALDILRSCTTPPLNIVVLWRSLDGAGIYRDTPIGIDGLPGLRVGQYLDMLALSLSAGAADRVGYTVHGGVITFATIASLPAPRPVTRVYDISDLTAPPANYRLGPMGYGGGLGTGYGMGLSSVPGNSYSAARTGAAGSPRGR
jgi:hypothetical protein